MSFPVLVVVLVVVVGVAVALGSWWFSEAQRVKRALRAAPRLDVRDAMHGATVRLSGRVEEHEGRAVVAPLSGRRCAGFEVIVDEYRSSGKSGSWRRIIREVETIDFVLRDGTGRALIKPGFSQVAIAQDESRRSGFLRDASPELEAFLQRHGHSSQGWVFNRKLRYLEGALEIGESVAVYGKARWEDDPSPDVAGGYRDRPRRLVVDAPDEGPMLLSDDPSTL